MFNNLLKSLSILKKFLFINLVILIILGSFTILYLKSVKPNLIQKKTANHIKVIDNTIDHILRLQIKFEEEDIRRFLFSTNKGESIAEEIIKTLVEDNKINVFEFQISRPDLETIFLRATKENWEKNDLDKRDKSKTMTS